MINKQLTTRGAILDITTAFHQSKDSLFYSKFVHCQYVIAHGKEDTKIQWKREICSCQIAMNILLQFGTTWLSPPPHHNDGGERPIVRSGGEIRYWQSARHLVQRVLNYLDKKWNRF